MRMNDKQTGIYVRVSSKAQDPSSQLPDLHRWAEADGDGPFVWYQDKFTGRTMDRPGFIHLMENVRAGKVARVVVWRLDRLGRTAKGLTALFEELRERKVNLVSLRDGLDLATPAGRLMANVLASVAAYETEVRAERIHAGLDVAKANGVRLGRPPGVKDRRPRKVTGDHREQIRRMKAEGKAVAAIARVTGLSRQTVYGVLGEGEADGEVCGLD
jgi:DNA invertase Pin-like site-specific DNA recombinase